MTIGRCRIRNGGRADGGPDLSIGCYLADYDPDVNGGRGLIDWTRDPAGAMIFDNQLAAGRCYTAVSRVRPVRPDGQPNRPLTGYTVIFEPVESVVTEIPAAEAIEALAADPAGHGLDEHGAAVLTGFLERGWCQAGRDETGNLHFKATDAGLAHIRLPW